MVAQSYRHCFESAAAAAGRTLSEAELDKLFSTVQGRMNRYTAEGMTPRDAAMRAGREIATEQRAAAAIERRNTLMNLNKRIARRAKMTAAAEGPLRDRKGVPNLERAIRNEAEAVNTPTDGGRYSAEAQGKARRAQYVAGMHEDLRKAGLIDAAGSGKLDDDTAAELWELSQKEVGLPAKEGVTGNKQAQTIAQIMHKYHMLAKSNLNAEGAWIGDVAGYILSTTHDPGRIYRATEPTWTKFLEPLLDDRTFEGVDDRSGFFKNVWGGLVTGVHFNDGEGVGFKDPAFSGPGNMAKRLSQSRVLHFKDAAGWMNYQREFGARGTLLARSLMALDRSSRQEALLSRWGTNPRAEFMNDIQWMKEKYRNTDPQAVINLSSSEKQLVNGFGGLDGQTSMPKNAKLAEMASNARNIVQMAKLGGVLFTHLSSGATKSSLLMHDGAGVLEAYGNYLSSFGHGFQGAARKELNGLIGAGVEGMHGRMLQGGGLFSQGGWIDDTMPGTMSKMSNNFFRMTGLTYLVEGQKAGASSMASHILGRNVEKSFEELDPKIQRVLNGYRISPADWDALRTAPDHYKDSSGRTYLTPDAADRSPVDMSPKARDALALKVQAFFNDEADGATITPGVFDRATLLRGTQPGTIEGEAARFIAQFKLWPVAAIRQGLGREMMGYGPASQAWYKNPQAISGVIHLLGAATVFGYLRMVLSDTSKGLTPRDPRDPSTLGAAFAQGGGAGIFGDFLFGQTNRFGGGVSDTLLGPILGENTNAIMKLWNDIKSGDPHQEKDALPAAVKLGLDNTPFVNLFYTRSALNYLFLYSLQETMNPGFLRRSQESLKKNTGQSYMAPHFPLYGIGNPQNHLKTFGR